MLRLVDKQSNIIAMSTFPYHVYESLSAGIGATVYDGKSFDTVYFDKELAHDFASWISGDSMEPTYHNWIRCLLFVKWDLIMMERFMQ